MQRILPSSREWPLFDVASARKIEIHARQALPAQTLMRRAGETVARLALAIAPHARCTWIAVGPGNNGGDGLEASIHLTKMDRQVVVTLLADESTLPTCARASFVRATAGGVTIRPWSDDADWLHQLDPQDIAIDALLGIGANRGAAGILAQAIRRMNTLACPVLAIDLPSGLNADTGQSLGRDCVVADHTLELLTCKLGLFTGSGRDHAGSIWLDELGADTSSYNKWVRAWLSPSRPQGFDKRRHAHHKGSFGDAMIVGGTTGMTGAALLAARAAHAAGAGRVHVHLLQDVESSLFVDTLRPELMFRGRELIDDLQHLARATVICGCGGGEAVHELLPQLLNKAGRLVLDADALNALAIDPALAVMLRERAGRNMPSVITPHPLEAARLLDQTTTQVQANRMQAATTLANRFECVVVLKGSGSVIAAPGHAPRINASGNASLASAGTGDVLAGWLGGLWAQCPTMDTGFTVAVQAVAQHGAASEPPPGAALRASDLIETLHRRQH